MKAIVFERPGEPDVLKLAEIADPKRGPGEILIRVSAAGVNGADLLQRRGMYPPPAGASGILGLEASGTVIESDDPSLSPGTRVMALLPGGGYAEKVSVASGSVMPAPQGLSDADAAAIPEAFITAYLELVTLGALQAGERVLIHAGASGVGTAAIQLARELGAEIFVTASSTEKLEACRKLGAKHLINYRAENFDERVRELTSGKGVDCILDLVGAAHWQKNISSLATDGRLLLVGLGGGAKVEADLRALLSKRVRIIGSTLRSRSVEFKSRLCRDFWAFAGPRLGDGRFAPVVDRVFALEHASEAHRYLEGRSNIGKLVLTTG